MRLALGPLLTAGRALGSVIEKKLKLCNLAVLHPNFTMHVSSPTLNYAAGVQGLRESKYIDTIQNRAIRCCLVVHRFTLIPAIQGDMAWVPQSIE